MDHKGNLLTKLLAVGLLAVPLAVLSACGDQGSEETAAPPNHPAPAGAEEPGAIDEAVEAIEEAADEAVEAVEEAADEAEEAVEGAVEEAEEAAKDAMDALKKD